MKKTIYALAPILLTLLIVITGCEKKAEEDDDSNNPVTGTVTDIDGNVYNTVIIGTQEWMAENLKTTHYRNGDPIPLVTDGTAWYNLSTPAYCEYDNDVANVATYGRMYNWYAVNTGILAPAGWHIPSTTEWATLETFLGDVYVAGGKMKETGTAHWYSPNTGATNESGFTGLPGGYRSSTGAFFSLTYNGYWWCSNEGTDPAYAWYRFLDFNLDGIYDNEDYKVDGLSVRCIKD